MKKNDKLIVLFGVIIIVLASFGVYYWAPEKAKSTEANMEDIFSISGVLSSDVPDAITVTDSSPFYPLIATPLAVHYDIEGMQHIVPLYVKNMNKPSSAVTKVESEIGMQNNEIQIPETSGISVKQSSLDIAKKYWKHSDGVLLIESNETGYDLGVVAVPLASYLSVPVIVTDELDQNVKEVLQDLGVKYSLVCGNIEGYGSYIKFDNVDEIVNASIKLVTEKFGNVKYITLANPRDAWLPEVLNTTIAISAKGTLKTGSFLPSHIIDALTAKNGYFTLKIPEDYKYALVKLDLNNLEDPKNIQEFQDNLLIMGSLTNYFRTYAGPAITDENGNINGDKVHYETVMYDMGGKEFSIKLMSSYTIVKSAPYELTVTVEKLSNPYYPMMKQFSSLAPYLAAYHQGIIFAKPEFAFVPDDNVLYNGKTLPGNTQVLFNPMLIPSMNQHVYENIHVPLNNLLAKITGINIAGNVEYLQKYCYNDPFYIALVGDSIMLPQYYYRSSHSDPFSKPASGAYGTNVPSDFIYGNIDPGMYSMVPYPENYLENDLYSQYPGAENVVGRIVGYDVQDESALIDRTIFYDDIINGLGDWKNNAAALTGAGTDMQKLPIINAIYKILKLDEPTKFPSGTGRFVLERLAHDYKQGGFNVQTADRGAAQRVGYSTQALWAIKTNGIPNLLLFPMMEVKIRQGAENIKSLFSPKWWVDALLSDGSGIKGGQLEENSNFIQTNGHAIWFEQEFGDVMMYSIGGPRILYQILARYIPKFGIRSPLDQVGSYTVRTVSQMNMGPSVMFAEGCGSGKIDGFLPTNSLASTYLHAGVNAYISPTTMSAFYGALEPRFGKGVGFGIAGYIKAAIDTKKGKYVPVVFNEWIFEKATQKMFKDNVDIGVALRDAKNAFLPSQFNVSFRWTPPLSSLLSLLPSDLPAETLSEIGNSMKTTANNGASTFPVEKYTTIYELNLLGDPAFNPYEPCNEGK